MNKNEEIISKLLYLSKNIDYTFNILAELSYHNNEETEQFNKYINDLRNYLKKEDQIINTIKKDDLEEINDLIDELDDGSNSFARLVIKLDDNFDLLEDDDTYYYTDPNANDSYADIIKDYDRLAKYYENIDDINEYTNYVIDKTSITSLKKLQNRIIETKADNKRDNNYRNRLIKELEKFKYTIYRYDSNLEKIGLEARFNIYQTPDIIDMDMDLSRIYYNQCIMTLEGLYSIRTDETNISLVIRSIFNNIYFEECLTKIKPESINKLIEVSNILRKNNRNTFGELSAKKLIKKQEN